MKHTNEDDHVLAKRNRGVGEEKASDINAWGAEFDEQKNYCDVF
jgi:hypothetical protein